jgi:mono/diheme cytochrome c family protein
VKSRVIWILGIGAVVVIVLVVVLGGGSAPQDPMTGTSEFDIPVQDPLLVAEGDVLYQANCAACHGSDLRGTDIGPSHLSVVYNPNHHGDGAFVLSALKGVRSHHWNFGDMAPVPGLSQENLDRIVAFVRETQRIEGFEPYPPG